jgi:plastocyanin
MKVTANLGCHISFMTENEVNVNYRRTMALCAGLLIGSLGLISEVSADKFRLVNPSGEPMPDLVVYLQANKAAQTALIDKISPPVEIHQQDKQFTPYITVMQKGHELQFVNDDDITHHIYSAAGPKRFSFKLKKDSGTDSIVFDQVGHISMGCNVHDWMSGHLLVVDTPYFAITDERGEAEFDAIPDADYTLTTWHPQLSVDNHRVSQQISTPLSQTLIITVTAPMADIPEQKSLDDFEFLEGY